MDLEVGHLRAGDVIFVTGGSSGKKENLSQALTIHGQRVFAALRRQETISLTERLPGHSHVMLGLNNGNIIHADGRTVALEGLEQALRVGTNNSYHFSIFRLDDLDDATGERIAAEAVRYLHQKYDFTQYLRPTPVSETQNATQFCSRLVAMAYRRADIPLTDLPDNRVLPIDLWRICQRKDWSEVTDDFVSNVDWNVLNAIVGPVKIPGRPPVDIATFMTDSNRLLRENAELHRKHLESCHDVIHNMYSIEALLIEYSSALLGMAKLAYIDPSTISEDFAREICIVLEKIPILLSLGKPQEITAIQDTQSNTNYPNDDPSRSVYAGLPTRSEIADAQANRETLRIMSYLLMAETGLMSICAQETGHKKFARFLSTDSEYVKKFLEAVPLPEDFAPFEIEDSDFAWVSSEADRANSKRAAQNINTAWKIVCTIKNS